MQNANTPLRACPRNSHSYVWQAGDTVESVSINSGILPDELIDANRDIDFQTIRPGTVLCVPIGDTTGGAALNGSANDPFFVDPVTGANTTVATPPATATPTRPGTTVVVKPVLACPIGFSAATVRRGQSYADLLIENNVSYNAMRTANPALNPAYMTARTRFCAPPAGARQACAGNTYRVQYGETLAVVAQRFGVTPGRLLMLNPCLLPTDFTEGALVCVP